MLRMLIGIVVVAVGCSATTTATTVAAPPTTDPPAPTTTTTPEQAIQIQTCSSPPVTFSTLCEIYELLEDWHVDRPLDPSVLAESALGGLESYTTTSSEEPPRTLFCAIPHDEFVSLCDALGQRMTDSQLPAGEAVEAAVAHMTDTGLDPFTYYLPPEQAGNFRFNGIVGGIGVLLDARDAVGSKCAQITDVCRLEVVTVLEDNPGWEAGLTEGDVITAIDNESVDGLGFASAVALIAGDETGVVSLTVDREGEQIVFDIERRELIIPTVEFGVPFAGVGYLSIPDFEADITSLVDDAIAEIEGQVSTLVVDLRDNPGGFIHTVVEVMDRFVDDGVVLVSDAPDEFLEYTATPGGPLTDQELVVLVNAGTASAAEILAGALRDRRGAVVVGSTTFGKDAIQIPFSLRNGGELYVAVARWSTPNGSSVGDGGLIPDTVIEWPQEASMEDIVSLALEASS